MNAHEDPSSSKEPWYRFKLPYKYAMEGRWERMYKFFQRHIERIKFLRLSLPRDNALHLTAHSKEKKIFTDMYELVMNSGRSPEDESSHSQDEESHMEDFGFRRDVDPLYNQQLPSIPNSYGNTVLHEAVIAGNLNAVKFLVEKHEELLEYSNNSGETPFFRAASLGHTKIVEFLANHRLIIRAHKLKCVHRQRKDNSTPILCIALQGEHFETALKLLALDRSLGEMADDQGITGLHLLARMPRAFKSGYTMNIFTKLIYFCLPAKRENDEHDIDSEAEEEAQLEYITPGEVEIIDRKPTTTGLPVKRENDEQDVDSKAEEEVRLEYAIPGVVEIERKDSSQNSQSSLSTSSHWLARKRAYMVTLLFGYSTVKRLYLSFCKFIFEGWPVMERMWNEKKKHTRSLRIAELLAGEDQSWVYTWQEDHRPDESVPAQNTTINSQEERRSVQRKDESSNNPPDQNRANTSREQHGPDQKQGESATKPPGQNNTEPESKPEIPLFAAASNGIIEIVQTILEKHPQAIEFVNHEQQNILHIAVMYRKLEIFNFIKRKEMPVMRMKHQIDNKGYTLLHQVADITHYPGVEAEPVLDLQDELKWFERVKSTVPSYYERHPSIAEKKIPWVLFSENHEKQLGSATRWIKDASQSCFAVAVLTATVVFAAVYQVPGGTDDRGVPRFLHNTYFQIFTVMDAFALAASLTAVVLFLSILSSPFRFTDFHRSLPRRLTLGFTLLLFSVITTMLAFSCTIMLIINLQQRPTSGLISFTAFLPVSVFALLQFRLFVAFAGNMYEMFKEVYNALPWFCVPFHKIKRGLKCDELV